MPTRLLAKGRKLMTVSSAPSSSPTRKAREYDNQNGFPSVVTHNSNTQGEFKECGAWDETFQEQEPRNQQTEVGGSHKESYQEEVTERIDWESDHGGLSILVTRTTSVTIDTLGSFDRPWEYLGPSIGSPTIRSG